MQSGLLTRKELGAALGHSRFYIWAMERAGFFMPAGRATIEQALEWLSLNRGFKCSRQQKATLRNIRQHRRR
jgi:hypothetical protein